MPSTKRARRPPRGAVNCGTSVSIGSASQHASPRPGLSDCEKRRGCLPGLPRAPTPFPLETGPLGLSEATRGARHWNRGRIENQAPLGGNQVEQRETGLRWLAARAIGCHCGGRPRMLGWLRRRGARRVLPLPRGLDAPLTGDGLPANEAVGLALDQTFWSAASCLSRAIRGLRCIVNRSGFWNRRALATKIDPGLPGWSWCWGGRGAPAPLGVGTGADS